MGMRIVIVWFAMRGPAGMTDANIRVKVYADQALFQFCNLSLFFINVQTVLQQRNPRTVITPVLQPLHALQYHRVCFLWSDIRNDSTHEIKFIPDNIVKKNSGKNNLSKNKVGNDRQ